MMPWEHVAVGYVCYSLLTHAVYRASPSTEETLVVVFASLLPDLIDKPLAWQFGVFESGYALGHSVFFAIPVSLLVLAIAISRDRLRLGIAFGVGYLVHLPADVLPQLRHGEFPAHRIFWPIRRGGAGYDSGFEGELSDNLLRYGLWMRSQLLSGNPDPYFVFLATFGLFTVLLWVYDGLPVGRELYTFCRRGITRTLDFVHGS